MLESDFQARFIKKLRIWFPDCVILKNDSGYMQGVPDLILLWNDRWAMLEVKPKSNSRRQPNQEWYVDTLNQMSYAAFVHPGNEEEVLHEIHTAFTSRRKTRVSGRKQEFVG